MCFIAFSDGESGELCATVCLAPTTSNVGTRTFVRAATATQRMAIGTANRRMLRATLESVDRVPYAVLAHADLSRQEM